MSFYYCLPVVEKRLKKLQVYAVLKYNIWKTQLANNKTIFNYCSLFQVMF